MLLRFQTVPTQTQLYHNINFIVLHKNDNANHPTHPTYPYKHMILKWMLPHSESEFKLSSDNSQILNQNPISNLPPNQPWIWMCSAPPLLLKHLIILFVVPPPSLNICPDVQNWDLLSPPTQNSQASFNFSCQSSITCISECGTPSWACLYEKRYYVIITNKYILNNKISHNKSSETTKTTANKTLFTYHV